MVIAGSARNRRNPNATIREPERPCSQGVWLAPPMAASFATRGYDLLTQLRRILRLMRRYVRLVDLAQKL
jgi:hypothetical protein